MLPATVGVQKSAVRQSALIRQVVLMRIATAGVVEHFLAAVRINRTVTKGTSAMKEIEKDIGREKDIRRYFVILTRLVFCIESKFDPNA